MMILYFIVVNIAAFVLFGIDKRRAQLDQWRIPEKTLLGISVIGGAVGGYAGMRVFRHKTQKPLFRYPVPILAVIDLAVMYYFYG